MKMKQRRLIFLAFFLICTTLVITIGHSALRPAHAAAGLVGYWKFDEGSGTSASDSSGSSNSATLQGSATWASGQIGSSALKLNGSGGTDADIATPVINTAQSFSVSAWVNLSSTSGYQTFASIDGSHVSAFYLQLRSDTGKFAFARLASDQTSAATSIASAASAPVTGTWYHLVGVYDASAQTIALYVNGSLQQTVAYTSTWQAAGHTAIGRGFYGGNPVDFVNGQIDDVHIYNLALSAESSADLAASDYWTFDEGSGTTAGDTAGNTRNGTLGSSASWQAGKIGTSSVALPGNSNGYVDVATPAVNTSQSFSVSAWVNLNSTSGYQTFASINGNQVSAFYLQLRADTGKFAFARIASDQTSGATSIASATSAPTTGTWYHLVGVYNATAKNITLYINGLAQQTVSYTGTWQASGHTEIGRGLYSGNAVDFVNGQIDDVHIYNIALDSTAANTLAGNPPTGSGTLTIQANQSGATVSPTLYGLIFEDISHSGDGGLYGELIRNRIFKDDPNTPVNWSVINSTGAQGSIALDTTTQVNTTALTTSLKLQVTQVASGQRVGVANTGYWGIPVRSNTTYNASFYALASADFSGPLTVDIESNDGSTIYAQGTVSAITNAWQKYSLTLTTSTVTPTEATRFVISAGTTGTVWLNLVSLFPPTWNNHPNGMRQDLMQYLDDMHPSFLRFPGGNYLEGQTTADYFPWKNTLGDLSLRAGHNDPWGYRSSDGLGLLEYLQWTEDLHMSPLLAVYAGYALNGTHIAPGTAQFNTIIQDAVDEIQYATGDISTTWGARRAADGHPAPFNIQYVEIGNEDFFDNSGSYNARFAAIFDAIRAAYPQIKLIATATVTSRTPDVYDQHYYLSPTVMASNSTLYDTYNRSSPKIFVGEYAAQEGNPTPDLNSALGDAAFMTGMERNSDVVTLSCYAPLFVNVNAVNWGTNLIAYDALNSYASPSYYVQKLFSLYHGDVVVPTQITGGSNGIYFVTSKVNSSGVTYIKVVNTNGVAQNTQVVVNGATSVDAQGTATVLTSGSTSDSNTLSNPTKIAPTTQTLSGLSNSFAYNFAPYSVTILQITIH